VTKIEFTRGAELPGPQAQPVPAGRHRHPEIGRAEKALGGHPDGGDHLDHLVWPVKGRPSVVMAALDVVNARFGKKTLVTASEGVSRAWTMRAEHRSPRDTTRIADLPVVR
jgi:hypothetical protein